MPPGRTNEDSLVEVEPARFDPAMPSGNGDGVTGRRRRRRWRPSRIAVAAVAVALIAVAAMVLLLGGSPKEILDRVTGGAEPPPRVGFVIPLIEVTSQGVAPGANAREARAAADQVRTTVSAFYDRVFLSPDAWGEDAEPYAWITFAPGIRPQASRDAASLTLGKIAGRVQSLQQSRSSLRVNVLIDAQGRAQAVVANVVFMADGRLVTGEVLHVNNRAEYIVRRIAGRWLIDGYPEVRTVLDTEPPPTPAAGPSAGPSASDAGGGAS